MSEKREGPEVRIDARCSGCRYEESVSYAVQGDSGHTVFCTHPCHEKRKYIGDTTWRTPEWCPLLPAALASLHGPSRPALVHDWQGC